MDVREGELIQNRFIASRARQGDWGYLIGFIADPVSALPDEIRAVLLDYPWRTAQTLQVSPF
jgi:hypothetical protein